eukprot:g4638.t1
MASKVTAAIADLPVFDLAPFLTLGGDKDEIKKTCKKMAEALHKTSVLIVKDPRVSQSDAGTFIDMMEDYFSQNREDLERDVRAELHYQVGATPENTERAICASTPKCKKLIDNLGDDNKPTIKPGQGPDPKWRFFWRIGERPAKSDFPELNAKQVIPKKFEKHWSSVMDTWGNKMIAALSSTAEMLALGFNLPQDAFVKMMKNGPHLLAPTGSNLEKYSKPETVFATFHQDLNFMTIHGKSRYPGLYIWLRDGSKVRVKIPDGCLLVQAGMQIEHLTGGYVTAGYHEVVATAAALEKAKARKEMGRPPWRVSSTLFGHIQSDQVLKPIGKFRESKESARAYPPTRAGSQVASVLREIALSNS